MSDPRPEQPTITVQGGPIDGYVLTLTAGENVVVGNGRQARLRIDYPEFAFTHLKITWDDLGVWISDMAARGTWLNGEMIQAAPLSHGDIVRLADPEKHPKAPFLRIGIPQALEVPEGTMPSAELFAPGGLSTPPASERPMPAAAPKAPLRRGRPRAWVRLPDPLVLGGAIGGVIAVAVAAAALRALFFSKPSIAAVTPAAGEPGQTLVVTGRRFDAEARANTLWFGSVAAPAESALEGTLQLKVPPGLGPGDVALVVETPRGRSGSVPFRVLPPLRAAALDPGGGIPGDEVVLRGEGFVAGVSVTVGSVAAEVVAIEPGAIRFRVPQVAAAPASVAPVVVTAERRSTAPLKLVLARLPLVASASPAAAMAGELVRLKGLGFAVSPEGNEVTFGGVASLVVASNGVELAVVAPPSPGVRAENPAPVVVAAQGRASAPVDFTLQRLVEGSWVPRCVAEPGPTRTQALVGTEISPLLLLSAKDGAASSARRALALCEAIDALLGRARVGERPAFEVRGATPPTAAVALAGRTDVLVRVTEEDAAAYAPAGASPEARPTPEAVARLWAALLADLVTVTTSGGAPSASAPLSPSAGRAFADLRAALPWHFGEGVSNARVAALRPDLRRRLREAALTLP